jgi:alkaline phosphatase
MTKVLPPGIGIRGLAGLLLLCVASAAPAQSPEQWFDSGREAVEQARALAANAGRARNVILFVGDGMGISTITAARILDGQRRGGSGEENSLAFERLPRLALSKTYSVNQQTSDSAPTMTAMVTGIKTNDGAISVNARVARDDFRTVAGRSASASQSRSPVCA